MTLVFSLPFCLLLPDGDYHIKLDKDDIVTLNLTKTIPKIYDERLPYRGFLKGEIERIDSLAIWDEKHGGGGWVDADQLKQMKEKKFITKYKTKNGKEIVPEIEPSIIDRDVDFSQDIDINPEKFVRSFRLEKLSPEITNQMISDRRNTHTWGRKIVVNAEVIRDPSGRFRYTKVRFTANKDLHYEEQIKMAIRAVNILIIKYRRITNSHWVTKVREEDVFIYKSVHDDSFEQSYSAKGIIQARPNYDENIVSYLRQSLVDNEPEFPFFHIYLDAKNAFEQADYYLAVILSIVALESVVKTYLRIYSQKCPPIIQDEVDRINLRRIVTQVLRQIFPTDDYKKLLSDVSNAIDLRNSIIHESEIDVPKRKAEKVLEDVGAYMDFIGGKFGDFSNQSSPQPDEII